MQWTFYGIYTTRYITLQDLDLAITGRDGGAGWWWRARMSYLGSAAPGSTAWCWAG